MPLTSIQRQVLGVLRPFRSQSDYVGGGAALNYNWFRLSDDMDIFHDTGETTQQSAGEEIEALTQAGFSVEKTTDDDWMVEVIVRKYSFETRVQWMNEPETSKRFFPTVEDEIFGFCLHQADLAVNKMLCASRRRNAVRDAVDLTCIVQRYAPLGPLAWAAAAKDEERSALGILRDAREIVFGYSEEEIRTVRIEGETPLSKDHVRRILLPAFDVAFEYCSEVAPIDHINNLFVDETEIPLEANEDSLTKGAAFALPIRNFRPIPRVVN